MTTLETEPKYFRAAGSVGFEPAVQRDGGHFGFGLIEGVSVITRGEALDHEMWIDHHFLDQVAEQIDQFGTKARFTHPGLSSDGIGQKLGKLTDAWVDGDQVYANLHFQEAATKTPDGNLADYVMTLAEETPEDFGLSIVFEHDIEASEQHRLNNTVTTQGRDIFTSPDEDNKQNYIHARLSRLRAGDVVDSPAANPDGLFHRRQEAATEAEAMVAYALGLSDAKPETSFLSVDGDRVKRFAQRFLKRHGLTIGKDGDLVSTDATETREDVIAELNRYTEAFGADGVDWFKSGLSFAECQQKYIESLKAENDSLRAKVGELQETISQIDLDDDDGAEFPVEKKPKKSGFGSRIRIAGKSYPESN